MGIARQSIDEVNSRLDAIAVAGDYVQLTRKGGRWWGCCPFHGEKTPSFTVEPEKKFYKCFGCGAGGSIINLVMEMDKLSFPEAVERLAARFGVSLVYDDGGRQQPRKTDDHIKEEIAQVYARIAGTYHHILTKTEQGAAALAYLQKRAIPDAMIEKFRLGYSPPDRRWLHTFLEKKGYSAEFLAKTALFSEKYPESSFFSGRLMFPIANRDGQTVAFGARLLAGDGPKYINSRETPAYKKGETLYAIDLALAEIRRTKEVYLCEGYMDVIAMHTAGFTNTVAPLGTAFTPEQAKLLHRWAERIFLLLDNDAAGQNAAYKAIITARAAGLQVFVVNGGERREERGESGGNLNPLKDPADILQEYGAGGLTKFAKFVIIDYGWLAAISKRRFALDTPAGVAAAVNYLFPLARATEGEVARQGLLKAIADDFGADEASVRRDFETWLTRNGTEAREWSAPETPTAEKKPRAEPVKFTPELYLLTAVFVNYEGGAFVKLRTALALEDFEEPFARELYIALEEAHRQGEASFLGVLSRVGDEDLRAFVMDRAARGEFSVKSDAIIDDGIKMMKVRRLEKRRADIIIKMKMEGNHDTIGRDARLDELLYEKVEIDEKLHMLRT